MSLVLLMAWIAIGTVAFDGPLPVFSELKLSEITVKKLLFRTLNNSIYDMCEPALFNQAQTTFNSELGINENITWRNASLLTYAVNKIIGLGVNGLVNVCNARRGYAGALLMEYPFCVNRFFLLEQGGTDFNNAVTYVHLFKHLEFLCSAGFDVYQHYLPCIEGVKARDETYNECYTKFQQTIINYPSKLCEASQTLIICLQNVFNKGCGAQTGWVECEMERLGYAYDCNGLIC